MSVPKDKKKHKKKKLQNDKKHYKSTRKCDFKCTNVCCQKNFYFKRMALVYKSIKLNYIFWITALISIALISFYSNDKETFRYRTISGIISFICAMCFGYLIHSLSHTNDACLLYNDSKLSIIKYFKSKPRINKFIIKSLNV